MFLKVLQYKFFRPQLKKRDIIVMKLTYFLYIMQQSITYKLLENMKICPQNSPPSSISQAHIFQSQNQNKFIHHNEPHDIQIQIFEHLHVSYEINQISINQNETLHTIFVHRCKQETAQKKDRKCFYLSHGFGGSSLMYFPVIQTLLEFGNIVLWQIRGMGLSKKLNRYEIKQEQISEFFLQPIQKMLGFYSHKEVILVSHSLSGYLSLLYTIKYKHKVFNIKELILLSPVGITPKQQDYKSTFSGISDLWYIFIGFLGWTFHLTYKSPLRTICRCFKQKLLSSAVQDCGFNQKEKELMKNLLLYLVHLPDGSQGVFFNYFQPRVLPKFPIQPILTQIPNLKITIYYGGEQDWVDKKGAQHIQQKFPKHINLKIVQKCGHNFPFHAEQLRKLFKQSQQNQ